MIPCYTCLEQSTPAVPADQSSTLDLPRIAHRLYPIRQVILMPIKVISNKLEKILIPS